MPQGRLTSPRVRGLDRTVLPPRPAFSSVLTSSDAARAPFSDTETADRAERSLELWRSDATGRGSEAFDRLLADIAHLPLIESYDVERSYRYVHRDTNGLAPTPVQLRSLEQAARGLSAKEAATELG